MADCEVPQVLKAYNCHWVYAFVCLSVGRDWYFENSVKKITEKVYQDGVMRRYCCCYRRCLLSLFV